MKAFTLGEETLALSDLTHTIKHLSNMYMYCLLYTGYTIMAKIPLLYSRNAQSGYYINCIFLNGAREEKPSN